MKWLAVPTILVFSSALASAQEASSRYSDLDLTTCKRLASIEDEGEGGEWSCPGNAGFDVHVWEGDLRTYVAYGPDAPAHCASMQTFGAFNSLGPRVEWRMRNGKPFATILRWFTEQSTDGVPVKQNWLVVTKLGERESCHVAYVDTKYADANEVARQQADEAAASFSCARDMPGIFSARGGIATDYATGMPCPGGPYREE